MKESHQQTGEKENIASDVRQYIEKRVQLTSLTIAEHVSLVIAESFQKLAGMVLLGSAVLFLWFALSFFLADVLNNTGLGFLIASLPLFLLGIIFVNTKSKKITERIQAELILKSMEGLEDILHSEKPNQENSPE